MMLTATGPVLKSEDRVLGTGTYRYLSTSIGCCLLMTSVRVLTRMLWVNKHSVSW